MVEVWLYSHQPVITLIYRRKLGNLWTILKEIVSLCSELDFLEEAAASQNVRSQTVDGGLNNTTSGLCHSLEILSKMALSLRRRRAYLVVDSACTENITVGKVLSSQIPDRQFGKNNARS